MIFLTVSGISKQEKEKFVVKDVSFIQNSFQKIAIAGETGAGKTTLLKMIAGRIQPTTGEIRFKQKKVLGPEEQLMPGHPGILYMSQHFELLNNYYVNEVLDYSNNLSQKDAETLYAVCRIEHLLQRRTDQLSGGEKQRIALARLLTASPQLLLLDEPFSNLDSGHKKIMKSVIQDIGEKLGITCLMVLHEAPDIFSWADTILIMKEGQIIQYGTPEQVYKQPVNEYCAGLLGQYNVVDSQLAGSIAALKGKERIEKKVLIRPEHISITGPAKGVKAVVQSMLFWGNYYTVDVSIGGELLRVQVKNSNLAIGDIVYISVQYGDLIYL